MKDVSLLIWLTQLGLSVAVPLAGFVLLAVWLHNRLQWGVWVIIVGVILGLISAISGLRSSLQILSNLAKSKEEAKTDIISFNDHD